MHYLKKIGVITKNESFSISAVLLIEVLILEIILKD